VRLGRTKERCPVPGPRKVRIFRDRKKSPNWYVEWRDIEGHRHCESCGPRREEAKQRARQIEEALQAQRAAVPDREEACKRESAEQAAEPLPSCSQENGMAVLQVHALLRFAQVEVPIDLFLQVRPDVLAMLQRLLFNRLGE
jgi:hypothetical protein